MGTGTDGNIKEKKAPIVVDNADALPLDLKHPDKFKRKIDDGTTIIFFDFPTSDRTLTITTKDDRGKKITSNLDIECLADNKIVKEYLLDATKQVQGLGDIKFFNLKDLSDADKEYLSSNGIEKIPHKADIQVYSYKDISQDGHPVLGVGGGKTPELKDVSGLLLINKDLAEGTIKFANSEIKNQEVLKEVILHELEHLLGAKHPEANLKQNNRILKDELDNVQTTIMSNNEVDNYDEALHPGHYGRLDKEFFEKTFNPSKTPDLGFDKMLIDEDIKFKQAFDEREADSKLRTDTSKAINDFNDRLKNKLNELIKDGNFDKSDLETLSRTATDLRDRIDPDQLKVIKSNITEFGTIRLGDNSDPSQPDVINISDGFIIAKTNLKGLEDIKTSDSLSPTQKSYELDLFTLKPLPRER